MSAFTPFRIRGRCTPAQDRLVAYLYECPGWHMRSHVAHALGYAHIDSMYGTFYRAWFDRRIIARQVPHKHGKGCGRTAARFRGGSGERWQIMGSTCETHEHETP